jgi:hypothetical protein
LPEEEDSEGFGTDYRLQTKEVAMASVVHGPLFFSSLSCSILLGDKRERFEGDFKTYLKQFKLLKIAITFLLL